MEFQNKVNEQKALRWALTNRSALNYLVGAIEIYYRAKDMQDDEELEQASKYMWKAYEHCKHTLDYTLDS